MHRELATALDQPQNAEHVDTAEVHAELQGFLALIGKIAMETASRRNALLLAELTSPNHEDIRGDTEMLHQQLESTQKHCEQVMKGLRDLASDFTNYDNYTTTIKTGRLAKDAREAKAIAGAAEAQAPLTAGESVVSA
jgi:hypothetical protein